MSRASAAPWALFAATAAALAVGCITFINTDPGGLSTQGCRFAGSDATACGACIAQKCQSAVDDCCRDADCKKYQLQRLDKCATGDVAECEAFYSDPGDALEKCIETGCGTACLTIVPDGGDGKVHTKCTVSSSSCSCVPDPVGDGKVCAPTTITGGTGQALCCVDDTWPASGSSCTCRRWGCDGDSFRCTCSASVGGAYSTCDGNQFNYCCRSKSSGDCVCRDSPSCTSSETQVATCDLQSAACGSDEIRVTEACSLP